MASWGSPILMGRGCWPWWTAPAGEGGPRRRPQRRSRRSPAGIASESEMSSALAAASNAVRRLTIDESIYPDDEDLPPYWGIEMEAAMVVASWTPEGRLIVAWIGDSIPFLLPAGGGRCWAGEPMSMSGTSGRRGLRHHSDGTSKPVD